jgi:hypothetical protein
MNGARLRTLARMTVRLATIAISYEEQRMLLHRA